MQEPTVNGDRVEAVVFETEWFRIHQVPSPFKNGSDPFYIMHRPDSVTIVPISRANETVLVRQYRVAAQSDCWELPKGLIDPGETAVQAARRELQEETGIVATDLCEIGKYRCLPGFLSQVTTVFLARCEDACFRDLRCPTDQDEIFALKTISLDDLEQQIRTGDIVDAFTIAAFAFLQMRVG
jgi:8-oxo-dGTP pyrophosphatase MutT (NUDIX family)